jgi:hypothetical protein
MSDSEPEVEIPEPKVLTKPRPKKVMTPEQLEKLAAARVKAAKVKVAMKEERIEKEKVIKDEIRAQKLVKTKQKLENEVDTENFIADNKKAEAKKEVAAADESDKLVEKVEKVKVTKKKKAKKPVVIVDESNSDSSDSDDNSNIIYLKRRGRNKKKETVQAPIAAPPAPAPAPPPKPIRQAPSAYDQMVFRQRAALGLF